METGRNWQGWAALLLAGLALFVALSGHLDFRFSLSNGSANAVTEAQAVQIGPGAGLALCWRRRDRLAANGTGTEP